MNITIPSLSTIYTHASASTEALIGYAGKLLNRTYVFIQTQPGTYLAVIGANIVAFELALAICRLVNHIFGDKANPSQGENDFKGYAFLFTAIVGGTVYVCCKKLSIPLAVWRVIGISFATNFIYLCCKTQ